MDLFKAVNAKEDLEAFAELAGWRPTEVNTKFLNQFQETMKLENPNRPTKPGFIRPSSLTECLRKLVFEYLAEDEESHYEGTPRIGESGTDAHKRIQGYIMSMREHGFDVDYIDVKAYLEMFPNPDLEIVDETKDHEIVLTDVATDRISYKDGDKMKTKKLSWYLDRYHGGETLVLNKKTHSRFKADGIVRFNGKYYVLEIKTENSKKYASHVKTLEPHDKHRLQGGFYGISFGIDDVMFLYENRDTCATFITILNITKELKEKINRLIADTIKYGDGGFTAPRTIERGECMFCPYKGKCDRLGDTFPR